MFWSKSEKDGTSKDNSRNDNNQDNRGKSKEDDKLGFFNKLFQNGCDSDFVYYEE